ncbi:MAG TPA: hypothetical protein VJ692_00910 [Nitrospiraceae bacterium]|nr:hypothetical protein [Nitrospiraceae bacterium]
MRLSRWAGYRFFPMGLCLLLCLAYTDAGFSASGVAQIPDRDPKRDAPSALDTIPDAQRFSKEGDRLVKDGREQDAVYAYLEAHKKFQHQLLHYFEQAFRSSLGGAPADEEALTKASQEVSSLRNVNLSKLWIVLDPEDRAYTQGLEEERAALLPRFEDFRRPASADPLEHFLHRLYPDDASGDRQMEALRDGNLPPSKRWARLGIAPQGATPRGLRRDSP